MQVCRVEEFQIEGTVKGSVVHAQRTRAISITPEGVLTASGWGLFDSSLSRAVLSASSETLTVKRSMLSDVFSSILS